MNWSDRDRLDRARAALWGLALGDALGMPFQLLSRSDVYELTGDWADFQDAPASHPVARGLVAGSVTDDTLQALLLARLLIEGDGQFTPQQLAEALVAWEDEMRERGSLDLLGPSTKKAIDAVLAGVSPERSGRFGSTNGAAMRVTPVAICTRPEPVEQLIDAVMKASTVTHNTSLALSAACAVAAAVSSGIDGASLPEALEAGVAAAEASRDRGYYVAGADVATRIRLAMRIGTEPAEHAERMQRIEFEIGTSLLAQESVPAAFAILAAYGEDPCQAARAGAALGGDADTIAAIVGAIAGATRGMAALPADALQTVQSVNTLNIDSVARDLLALR